MVIGPFKETIADVINPLYGVGGFNIVKNLTPEAESRNKCKSLALFKQVNHAVKEMASGIPIS